MNTLIKMNESQVEEYLNKNEMNWADAAETLRKCSSCELYVNVDNISSEIIIDSKLHYEVCYECSSKGAGLN